MMQRSSYLNEANCNKYLKGSPLAGLGKVFLQAEKETLIPADLMMALCQQESGKGRNAWSKSPYNNCTSWGVHDSGPTEEAKFASFTECILMTARYLKDRFLNPKNWRWERAIDNGFDPLTLEGVGSVYASDHKWADGINAIRKEILSIMPEEVTVKQDAVEKLHLVEPVSWDAPVTYLVYAWILHKGGTV
jgi:beta-N-acetylglucosaminidase